MSVLDRTKRRQLLDILEGISAFDTNAGRTILLQDLPPELIGIIQRSEAKTIDLTNIVNTCDTWVPDDTVATLSPLYLIIENARRLMAGSQDARQLERLLVNLSAGVPVDGKAPGGPTTGMVCPYPGMVPFHAEDARFFYGRTAEIRQLVLHLRQQHFLLVIGPSGSGKSSLISAGLVPQLANSPYWAPGYWRVVTMRPGAQPVAALIGRLGSDQVQPAIAAQLQVPPPAQRLLLIVDQFEEIFTQAGREEQGRFIASLKTLRALDTCTVLMTMRADFYPDLMNSDLWPLGAGDRIEIAPLRGDALREAIQQPAADVGVQLEAGLLERLLADAADEPGSLPLLQETLVLLWGEMKDRVLPLDAYERLGGPERSGLAVALATRADSVMADLSPAQCTLARRIFLRLIQFGEGRPDTRRQQPLAALRAAGDDAELFGQTMAALTDNRLLTLSGTESGGGKRVDIAHEALITSWPTLRQWLAERREAEQTRRRLEEKAAEWVRMGQGRGGLLDESELPEAERWLASPDAADLGTSAALPALITVSRATIEQAARAEEEARQHELEQAQALAELERQRAEEQQQLAEEQRLRAEEQVRATRRLRQLSRQLIVVLAGTLLLLLLAIGLGWWALQSNTAAQQQTRLARAQAVAAEAVDTVDSDPELSTLLALEAFSTTIRAGDQPLPRTISALHSVVLRSPLRRTLHGHTKDVNRVVYSPDGKRLATASGDKTAKVWDAATGQELLTLQGHTDQLWGIAYSPDGTRLVTASNDDTAIVWDANTGQKLLTLKDHSDHVNSAAFSPDGRFIVTASNDKTAKIWDAATGQIVRTLPGHDGAVLDASYSPDGRSIATASADQTAKIWDVATGQPRLTLTGHTARVLIAAYSPDGQHILTGSDWPDSTVRVWDATTGALRQILRGHIDSVRPAYSPKGHYIVSASDDKTVRVWDAATGAELRVLHGHSDRVRSAVFSPDERFIASGSEDTTVNIWDTVDGQTLPVLALKTGDMARAMYSPDDHNVLTVGVDGTAKIWDAATDQVRVTMVYTPGIDWVTYSPDGQSIAATSGDGTAQVWNATTGQLRYPLTGHTDEVQGVDYSPDGASLTTTSSDKTVRVWDAATGGLRFTLTVPNGTIWNAKFSPDGQMITTVGEDGIVRIWDAVSGHLRFTLQGHTDNVGNAQYSPDSRFVVTNSEDKTARVWDLTTGQARFTLQGHTGSVYSANYSPDGLYIVTASADGTAKVWDAATGRERFTLRGHTKSVSGAEFSPDGLSIVTASDDGTAKLWDAATGQEYATLPGDTDSLHDAVFSHNGRRVLTYSSGGVARQYLARTTDLVALATSRVSRLLRAEERFTYLGEPLPASTQKP